MADHMSKAIEDFIRKRVQAKFEKVRKSEAKSASRDDEDVQNRTLPATEKFEPGKWLDNASERAKQISLATHALKFTHPWAEGSSVYVQQASSSDKATNRYLGTSDLAGLAVDAVGNAAALDVAQLLQLEINGYRLIDAVALDDSAPLAPFS